MPRRRNIKASRKPAITITRQALRAEKLVYLAVANKSRKYPFGYRSPILYIGTTRTGVQRIAQSAAARAQRLLVNHGVSQLQFHVVSCTPLRNVRTWQKLERALLLAFKHTYGSVPVGNTAGKNARWRDELEYFSEKDSLPCFEASNASPRNLPIQINLLRNISSAACDARQRINSRSPGSFRRLCSVCASSASAM